MSQKKISGHPVSRPCWQGFWSDLQDSLRGESVQERRLIDVWGHVGFSNIVKDTASAQSVEEMYKHYWAARFLVSIPRMIKTNGNYLRRNEQGAGANFLDMFDAARDSQVKIIIVPDFHVDGDGAYGEPARYHGRPPDGAKGYSPFARNERVAVVEAVREILRAADPDYIQIGNEPRYHSGWANLTDAQYDRVIEYFAEAIQQEGMSDRRIIVSDIEAGWESMARHLPTSPRIFGTHPFVFPDATTPDQLYADVRARATSYPAHLRPLWFDEGSGVGKRRVTPAGITSTETGLGADLTEALLTGCWDAGVVPGLLQIAGDRPICGEQFGMCTNLIPPTGGFTPAANRIRELIPVQPIPNGGNSNGDTRPVDRKLAAIARDLTKTSVKRLITMAKRLRYLEDRADL